METELVNIKNTLIEQIKKAVDTHWVSIEICIDFLPFINRAWKGSSIVKDANGENLSIKLVNLFDVGNDVGNFVFKHNQDSNYNQIIFSAKKDSIQDATIQAIFNQQVEDDFRSLLPKSWKKKTWLPWWKNPEETKGLDCND